MSIYLLGSAISCVAASRSSALLHRCSVIERTCLYLLGWNSNCEGWLCSDLVAAGRFLTLAHENLQLLSSEPQEGAAGIEEIPSHFCSAVASSTDNKSAQQLGEADVLA
ncbi:uncharacterized protein [Aegilops tauschii subsp. strangulata]|uniref:uncharacterized protein n=1 Tax=Aegilops tauschii subsp. strangulata TaxID=200361 RepID=UPI003CC855E8